MSGRPVLLQVWTSLVAACAAIRREDGYHTTVQTATGELAALLSLPAPAVPAVMVLPDGETSQRVERLGGVLEETLAFQVEARIDAPGVTQGEKAGAYAELVADIERAVTRDVTRGGLAQWTRVRPPRGPFMGLDAGGVVLFQQRIEVVVIRRYGES